MTAVHSFGLVAFVTDVSIEKLQRQWWK